MKRLNQWMFAAILTICGTLTMGLTSCSEEDNPVTPVNPNDSKEVEALNQFLCASPHVDISDYMMEENNLRVWVFKKDKTFVAYDLSIDDEDGSFQIDESTGEWSAFVDGKNVWESEKTEKLIGFDAVYDEFNDAFSKDSRTERFYAFNMANGEKKDDQDMFFLSEQSLSSLFADFKDNSQQEQSGARTVTRATSIANTPSDAISTIGNTVGTVSIQDVATKQALEEYYKKTMALLNTAGKTEAGYNINAKTFTRENWREQKFIYRYTGEGNITDENGSKGYTREALPWADGETVSSHLPFNFCDDIQPANGWDLVFNACGIYDVKNQDFFAVYNKFTGLLRFFVFLPNLNVADANDHAWEVTLTEQLAHRQNYKFGIPISQNIVNKAPLGLRGTDYGYIITPWVDSKTNDGFAPPGGGWWAFDVDLSQYRPDFQTLNERIRLEMRVWSNSQVSLRGTLNAKIKEKSPAEESMLTSIGGFMTKAEKTVGTFTNLITNFTTGNWWGALKSTIEAATSASNIVTSAVKLGSKVTGNAKPKPEYIVKQYFDGTIDTEGLIKGSRTVSGMNTITYPLMQFDVNNTTLGQGVWNLKTPPTLVCLGFFNYNSKYNNQSDLTTLFPQHGNINKGVHYTLDPRSIEVVLNPNVFPKDQIEWKRVTAVCGVRKGTKHDTHDAFRMAIGMSNNAIFDEYLLKTFSKVSNDNPCYDYLYDSDDKQGMTYRKLWENVEIYTAEKGKSPHHLVGRGNDNYMLEPTQFSSNVWEEPSATGSGISTREALSPTWIPSFEVNVTVTVKLKNYDKPIVLTRVYLPNYKTYSYEDMDHILYEEHEKLDNWLADLKSDATNKTEWQEYQVKHIKSQFKFLKPDYETVQATKTWLLYTTSTSMWKTGETAYKLFDHCPATKWFAKPACKRNGVWYVEFRSNIPCTAKTYTFTAPSDVESHKGRNPREWALYGKKQKSDPWTQLDYRHAINNPADAMPTTNSATKTYTIQHPGEYSIFQLVVTSTIDDETWYNDLGESCWISISCLDFGF